MADAPPNQPVEPPDSTEPISPATKGPPMAPVVPPSPRKPDFGIYLGILGILVGGFLTILQANGVPMNWIVSAIAYLCILVISLWTFLVHAAPHRTKLVRYAGIVIQVLLIGGLDFYGTHTQYRREHSLPATASASVSVANSPGAIVGAIQNSPNATQNLTVNQTPKRSIGREQADKMKAILAPFAGSRIDTIGSMGDSESKAFAFQLDGVFHSAGWKTDIWFAESIGPIFGVLLRMSRKDFSKEFMARTAQSHEDVVQIHPTEIPDSAAAIVRALNVLDIRCTFVPVDELPPGQMELRIGSNN